VSRSRLAAAIAIPLLLALGLAFTFLQGRHPAGQAAPTTVAPSSSIPPPPTTSKPNPPKATGEDWLAIMSDILTYRHQLYEHPQPNLLSQIYDKRCPCYQREFQELNDLERRGWRYDDEGVEILKAKLLGQAKDRPADVAVETLVRARTQVLVDAHGVVVKRVRGTGPAFQDYELIRGQDGRWRVLFELPVASGGSRR
jgi:hypothetical protein